MRRGETCDQARSHTRVGGSSRGGGVRAGRRSPGPPRSDDPGTTTLGECGLCRRTISCPCPQGARSPRGLCPRGFHDGNDKRGRQSCEPSARGCRSVLPLPELLGGGVLTVTSPDCGPGESPPEAPAPSRASIRAHSSTGHSGCRVTRPGGRSPAENASQDRKSSARNKLSSHVEALGFINRAGHSFPTKLSHPSLGDGNSSALEVQVIIHRNQTHRKHGAGEAGMGVTEGRGGGGKAPHAATPCAGVTPLQGPGSQRASFKRRVSHPEFQNGHGSWCVMIIVSPRTLPLHHPSRAFRPRLSAWCSREVPIPLAPASAGLIGLPPLFGGAHPLCVPSLESRPSRPRPIRRRDISDVKRAR